MTISDSIQELQRQGKRHDEATNADTLIWPAKPLLSSLLWESSLISTKVSDKRHLFLE